MTPRERDRLRAAWLTGGLTSEERRGLLQEAARDQALFDELMDAEPVRELLSEPETRAEALRRLRSAAPAASLPWWRQHWSWAGAGALALAGLFLLVVVPRKQAPVEAPVQLAASRPAAPPAPEPAAPAASAPLQLNRPPRGAGASGSIDSQPGRPGDLRAQKPKAAPAARANEELPEAVRTERDAKGADELRAAAPAEIAAFREKKAERADARDRPSGVAGGAAGGVVGGIIGGVPASSPPPPPPAAEVAANRPAPQARQDQERFGQRAAGGPMQSAPVQQSVAMQQQKEGLARKVAVESGLADAAQTVAKSAAAQVSAPFKATLGLRHPDGAIRSVLLGEPVDRGAPLVLTIEAAEQGVVRVAGLPGRTPPSRNLGPGEKWVLDLPTAEAGVRTLRVVAGAVGAAPVAGFAASNRIAAPLSISYQVR
jgi:hypothetical protein